MDVFEALSALTTKPGVTGNEVAVSEVVKGYYKAYTDDIFIDPMGNTYGRIGDHGPTLLVQAHMDEVGMMVTAVEDNGMGWTRGCFPAARCSFTVKRCLTPL